MGTAPELSRSQRWPEGRGLWLGVRVRGSLPREGLFRKAGLLGALHKAVAAYVCLVLGREREEGEHGLPSLGSLWLFKYQLYQLF